MTRKLLLAAMLALSGCAPPGYHYGEWGLTNPGQAFTVYPNAPAGGWQTVDAHGQPVVETGPTPQEQQARAAEAAARVADADTAEVALLQEMRAHPDATTGCGVGWGHFYTTERVCAAVTSVAYDISNGRMAPDIYQCANRLAAELPGGDEPTYLNACESLIHALRGE